MRRALRAPRSRDDIVWRSEYDVRSVSSCAAFFAFSPPSIAITLSRREYAVLCARRWRPTNRCRVGGSTARARITGDDIIEFAKPSSRQCAHDLTFRHRRKRRSRFLSPRRQRAKQLGGSEASQLNPRVRIPSLFSSPARSIFVSR